jgi:hypothetical protein
MRLVRKFGEMWARNLENINLVPHPKQGGTALRLLIRFSYRLFKPAFGTAGEILAGRHRGSDVFALVRPPEVTMLRCPPMERT